MSIGAIVFYAGYQNNDVITTEITGCVLNSGTVVCEDPSHEDSDKYTLYGYTLFFLNEDTDISEISALMDASTIIVQGDRLDFYMDGQRFTSMSIFTGSDEIGFDDFFASMKVAILIGSLVVGFAGNLFLLLFISLVSTIPFIRLRKFIKFGKIYKLVIFAITPIAFLMTFYNLLDLHQMLFFVLMFIGYRSIYLLQRELYYQTMMHLQSHGSNTVDSEYSLIEDDESEESENSEDDDS